MPKNGSSASVPRATLMAFCLVVSFASGGEKKMGQDSGSKDKKKDLIVSYSNALKLETRDGEFSLKLGGRIHNDFAFFSQDRGLESALGTIENSTAIRRARLSVSGTLKRRFEFKVQYDFAKGELSPRDVYLGITEIPVLGRIRIGQHQEPFSLQQLTSSNNETFIERGLSDVFAPSRNTGITLSNAVAKNRLTWAVGIFRDTDGVGFPDKGNANFTGRITGLPWSQGDDRFLHLGFGYSRRNPDRDLLRFRQRPEVNLSPRFVNTGRFFAASVSLINPEVALVLGPFSAQGEYVRAFVDSDPMGDPQFSGGYVRAGFFITGEHRRYKPSEGKFDRVSPNRNVFFGEGGPGAWEVAFRYSTLDLRDGGVDGGELDGVTVGLNWYLNPVSRIMFNYIRSDLDTVGSADILAIRLQVAF